MADPLATPVFDPNADARQKLVQSLAARLQALQNRQATPTTPSAQVRMVDAAQGRSGVGSWADVLAGAGDMINGNIPPAVPTGGAPAAAPPKVAAPAAPKSATSPQLQALLDRVAKQKTLRDSIAAKLVLSQTDDGTPILGGSSSGLIPMQMLEQLGIQAPAGTLPMGLDINSLTAEELQYLTGRTAIAAPATGAEDITAPPH